MKCPRCGSTDIEPDDRFCGDCRQPLAVKEESSQPSPRCIACKAELQQGDDFCGECGQSQINAPDSRRLMKCPRCGSSIEPGDRFCGDCQHPLAVKEESSQPSPRCIVCQAELQQGDIFCDKCGQSQTVVPASKTPQGGREIPIWTGLKGALGRLSVAQWRDIPGLSWLAGILGQVSTARWHQISGRSWLAAGLKVVVVIVLVFGALTLLRAPEAPVAPPPAGQSSQPQDASFLSRVLGVFTSIWTVKPTGPVSPDNKTQPRDSSLVASLFGFVSSLWHRDGGVPVDNDTAKKGAVKPTGPGSPDNNTRTGGSISEPVRIVLSDSFDRANANHCALGVADLALGGSGTHYYLPIFSGKAGGKANPIGADIVAKGLYNNGLDFGGVQISATPNACSNLSARGEDVGQDINIRVNVLSPTDHLGNITQSGPYFRSRAASSGDDIIDGNSGGFWVALYGTGEVKVISLNPLKVVAFSGKPAYFDNRITHTIEVAVQGNNVQVALDSHLLTFNQEGALNIKVLLPVTMGANDGAAGIAFGAMDNRGQVGGQRADSLVITTYRSLHDLPVQNAFAGKPSS
jgi:hypothetical protein